MFTKIDLIIGAIGIRILRKYKKIRNIPDVVFVKENLAFGGVTSSKELSKLKIHSVIDLRAEYSSKYVENELIEYHKFDIIDGDIPSESQINQIHEIISKNEKQGKAVFIHCNLGRGRATLTTLSYLLREGMSWEIAIKKIKKRKFVYLNKKQIDFLKKFLNELPN